MPRRGKRTQSLGSMIIRPQEWPILRLRTHIRENMKWGMVVVEASSIMIPQSMCHSRRRNCQQMDMEGRSSVTTMGGEVQEWAREQSSVVDISQC